MKTSDCRRCVHAYPYEGKVACEYDLKPEGLIGEGCASFSEVMIDFTCSMCKKALKLCICEVSCEERRRIAPNMEARLEMERLLHEDHDGHEG